MEEKIKNAKNFDDLDELFAYYTTSQGGDLMNAFLEEILRLEEVQIKRVRGIPICLLIFLPFWIQ